ncbi:hypothetical protein ACJMK2_023855 [Sinanodonta woodiana]|uniref:Uncharacterized protein n=1 Tax=Sinanodonta woodiana TaxID=1069815 RepID=A0ABD3T6B7_SINWO
MDNHRARKRKIDKDGFVTPATPDIPKTSCQYVDYSSSGQEDYKDSGFLGFSRSEETDDLQSVSYYRKSDALSQLSHQQEMKSHCKDDDDQDSIQQLMKDLIRESGCIIEQWSQVFSGSENFENFCLSRLDQLSEKAGTIEESLKQQKNKLCHRLRGLTNTLQEIEN